LGDGRTPKLPSQDIGAPFSCCYPPVNRPQVPGGCPLTARSLPLSLSLYLTFLLTFSVPLPRSRVFSASSSRGSLLSVRREILAHCLDGATGRRSILPGTRATPRASKIRVADESTSDSSSGQRSQTWRVLQSSHAGESHGYVRVYPEEFLARTLRRY